MTRFGILSAVTLATLFVASEASAGLFGSAFLNGSARIEISDDGGTSWRKIIAATDPPFSSIPAGADILITDSSQSSTSAALVDADISGSVSKSAGSIEVDRSFIGSTDPGNNGGFTDAAAEQRRLTGNTGSSYAYGDTENIGGNLVNLFIGGSEVVQTDANFQLAASTQVIDTGNSLAFGSVGSSAAFGIDVFAQQDLLVRFAFTPVVELVTDLTSPPANGTSFAKVTFSASADSGGETLSFAPVVANQLVTRPDDYSSSAGEIFSNSFTIVAGNSNFSFNASVTAGTDVPEPASLAIFGLVGLCGVAVRRRRRQAIS